MTVALVLSSLALAVSLLAAGLAVVTMRQSGAVATLLNRHRLGHEQREGSRDPSAETERRRLNLGPPRSVGERRVTPGYVLPPEETWDPADAPTTAIPAAGPATVEAAAVRPTLPRPGQIGPR